MKLIVSDTYQELSERVASVVIELVNNKKNAVLTFPSGDSPLGLFQTLVRMAKEGVVDFSSCHFVGLDEWVGLDINDEGSCQHFIHKELFKPLGIRPKQITFFDAKQSDLKAECKRVDSKVDALGGIDLVVLGIGMNGHLGFNEPGASEECNSLVIDLDSVTKTVGQKYFAKEMQLSQGISLGLKQIMTAGKVILIANGKKKAPIIKRTVEEAISNKVPASIVRKHKDSYLYIDAEAASELTDKNA
ncbi:glucosamine-6-phosphate isomerase [Parabacteroides sp. PF5-5]|uniref:glucosamine-6-phosphate deaminase n=1 Tax=unclassified Parabacteroides TaxID=2649774 RepID=UPI00247620B9|nr:MULTISPECIES: glucosamine-6-phosphate deaminase [unclassified Parabacteroides]MDH6305440.1 glucosamine-6-phosphate isomerase [Parabacteroides sp. PH5-39]MDH6316150.1 glucosamine-6-phosphate isomerase [Parabacteroides sp. PF5-13]MDH6320300.1 glucosamine-6-phosphate isomerase [Parabacteroides sp. PH5-13]MDH6324030.1 glucosamine-6-phosphate isomerase [Parabacteroides sp. PH5-8]MDH6327341.1 glucosamine-6-phosphate isomerase [Parabacteroides sp. PH5-41]